MIPFSHHPARLDIPLLQDILGPLASRFCLQLVEECASTNSSLLEHAAAGGPSGEVLIALRQTAGRGRRGRAWHASPGSSLTFSVLWRFPRGFPLHGLSLGVGVAITRALESIGADGLALKWPNDILLYGRKLGGVLVEATSAQSEIGAVIGIGLNVLDDPERVRLAGQPCAYLAEAGVGGGQESLLAALLKALLQVLDDFSEKGFMALQTEWLSRNAFQHLPVRVLQEGREVQGVCRGVDEHGALLIETISGLRRVWGGEVSLRPGTAGD